MNDADASAKLDAISIGFRSRYLTHDAIGAQLRAWQEAFPEVVRVTSLGASREGRELWLVEIGPDPDRIRPIAWVDGNMHASELAGSSVALAIAEDVIRAHVAPSQALHDLPPSVLALLRRDVLFHVMPRMCPDGAEQVIATGRWVRSSPHDDRAGKSAPYFRLADVDGDGRVLFMRRKDEAGDYVESAEVKNLMLPRRIEDEGPFYALYPEGFIEHFDGVRVPAPDYLSDNETDLNRNFSHRWAPEPEQKGAGAFAASERESRAVTEHAVAHPSIFAWLNLHTFGGVYIRPCGDKPDTKMDPSDLAVFQQVEEWGDRFSGYPTVSGFEEFTYEPDKPLLGDLAAFAYAQRGAIGFVCELWDFWKQCGLPILRPFVHNYQRRKRGDALKMAAWDREHNEGRIVGAWRHFDHPQLGPVEVGGYDPWIGVWNPPPDRLAEVCDQQAKLMLRLAALAPRLRAADLEVSPLGDGASRVRAVVENIGYLPTYVLASSKAFPWNDPVHARLAMAEGFELIAGDADQNVGHLGGWGGYDKSPTPSHPGSWTSGAPVRKRVEWVVRGAGSLTLTVGCARVGSVEVLIDVPST